MVAIPVFRARVAPVLDWCSKIVIFPDKGPDAAWGREIDVTKENIFTLMRRMREEGVKTLVCGALRPEMLNYGQSMGLRIIHGVAGDIEEVLKAYREQRLDQPQYWLPGCRGQRRYKGGGSCAVNAVSGVPFEEESAKPAKGAAGKNSVRTGRNKAAGGPGGFCVCPGCGLIERHERGIPCSQVMCPSCKTPMTRD